MTNKDFFPISPIEIQTNVTLQFDVYLLRSNKFILYATNGEVFTEKHRSKLVEYEILDLYIPKYYEESFKSYLLENLGNILNNPNISTKERSKVFHKVTKETVNKLYSKYEYSVSEEEFDKIKAIVSTSINFLEDEMALKNISELFQFDYVTFTHCLHVFTYALGLLMNEGYGEEELTDIGVGALLHDIGKKKISTKILNKKEKLDNDEWNEIKQHPLYGISECKNINISQYSTNCILFHHERYDGNGYPTGLRDIDIPLYVRVLTICDVYDAITSKRPYAEAQDPFYALSTMSKMEGFFDQRLLEKFIKLLGNLRKY